MMFLQKKMFALFFTLVFSLMGVVQAGPQVSLNVVDTDVRDVLSSLARLGNANIVTDGDIKGNITIQIHSLDFDSALELVTKMKGLTYHKAGDVILVGPKDNMSSNFGSMHIFQLKYANPSTVISAASLALGYDKSEIKNLGNNSDSDKATIKSDNSSGSSNSGIAVSSVQVIDRKKEESNLIQVNNGITNRLSIDKATNSLLFYGTDEEANKIAQMLASIDIPYQQVSVEAEIVAINKDASKNLGIEWEWSKAPRSVTDIDYKEVTIGYEKNSDGSYKRDKDNEQIPIKTVISKGTRDTGMEGNSIPGVISFGRGPGGVPYEFYYSAKINALVTDGKANILARPNIQTMNGREAVINIGGQIPIPTVTMNDNTTMNTIEYKDTGIILRYTPQINPDGYITANVYTEVSSPVYVEDLKAYRFNKRSADTVVRLKDGETMVIGGLIGSEESKSYSKIPFLGDLPILGKFFSNHNNTKNESEVMVFLTARIIK